jgi:hypothetical protein
MDGHLRCPYCHDDIALDPVETVACCGALLHRLCWEENGGCPALGCGDVPLGAGAGPRPVAWAQFVSDAEAWADLGAAFDDRAWGAPGPPDDLGPEQVSGPVAVPWSQFVAEAAPWVALGGAMGSGVESADDGDVAT